MINRLTQDYINNTPKKRRSELGQFFTPKNIRDRLISYLPRLESPKVAELNVGTGEFLDSIYSYFKSPIVYAYDIDNNVMDISKRLYPQAIYSLGDSLYSDDTGFDFVIGNPPYFETSNVRYKNDFKEVVSGRVNMYTLFIYKALKMLKVGGYLAMVVPSSMNNGAYFDKLRKFIINNGEIIQLDILSDDLFQDALQTVQILVIRKSKSSNKFVFCKNNICIFTENVEELERYWHGAYSLKELGYAVKTGNVVWNQHKSKLSSNPNDTLLVWAHNIDNNNRLALSTKKPQYIKEWTPEYNHGIVVNRITGANKNAKIKAALVNQPFAAENHVNVITGNNLEQLVSMLSDRRSLEALKLITGNTQLSKTELENLLPIYKGKETNV